MKKLFLLFLVVNFTSFAQSKTKNLFDSHTSVAAFQFSMEDGYSIDYQKYLNSPVPFSIYNPKPGFHPTKIESQKYYSFTNTNLLLKRQMSNLKSEDIYNSEEKKLSVGETIIYNVIDAVFDKK